MSRILLITATALLLGWAQVSVAQDARGAAGALRGQESGRTLPLPQALMCNGMSAKNTTFKQGVKNSFNIPFRQHHWKLSFILCHLVLIGKR